MHQKALRRLREGKKEEAGPFVKYCTLVKSLDVTV